MYVCISHVCLVPEEAKKRAADPFSGIGVVVVSCHVSAKNQT